MKRVAWMALGTIVLLASCDRFKHAEPESSATAPPAAASRPSPLDENLKSPIRSFDWTRSIGVASRDPGGELVFAVPDDSLPSGSLVTIVWLDEPQHITQARILGPRDHPWKIAGTPVAGRAYDLRADAASPKTRGYAIAISGEVGAPKVVAGKVLIDLDGDGSPETFRQCSSAEGLHLTIWSGEPLTSPQAWHRYLYLGMNLEVTCTETEAGAQ